MKREIVSFFVIAFLAASCSAYRENAPSAPAFSANQPATSTSAASGQPTYTTYTNIKYTFKVEYPADAVVLIHDTNGSLEYATNQNCKADPREEKSYKNCQKVAVWVDRVAYGFGDAYASTTIGGLTGQVFLHGKDQYTQAGWESAPHMGEYMGHVERGGNWYKFSMRFHWDDKDQAEREYFRLLSSFTFTAPSPSGKASSAQGWKLVSGDPTDTCTHPTFRGKASIRGWYVWETNYVSRQWMLRVMDDDVAKLPLRHIAGLEENYKTSPIFLIENPSAEMEERLRQASEDQPETVTVVKFSQYCEGAAVLTVEK